MASSLRVLVFDGDMDLVILVSLSGSSALFSSPLSEIVLGSTTAVVCLEILLCYHQALASPPAGRSSTLCLCSSPAVLLPPLPWPQHLPILASACVCVPHALRPFQGPASSPPSAVRVPAPFRCHIRLPCYSRVAYFYRDGVFLVLGRLGGICPLVPLAVAIFLLSAFSSWRVSPNSALLML